MLKTPIKKLYRHLERKGLAGLLITSSPNISYLTETISHDAYLLVTQSKGFYITDSRYSKWAKNVLAGDFEVIPVKGSLLLTVKKLVLKLKLKNLGIEGEHLSLAGYTRLKASLSLKLTTTSGMVEELRQIKTSQEIEKIKKAAEIAMDAINFIKFKPLPGMTELEVSGELEKFIRSNGGSSSAFDIIVASGVNSSFPHHQTSNRKIQANDLLLIDLGVNFQGYKSDLTRVLFLGKIKGLMRQVYSIVLKAQEKALQKLKTCSAANTIDAAARDYIVKEGYGEFFLHSLGHGIGLEVHEAPRLGKKSKDKLTPGMVFTLEPGIYLPNKFGIRLEDMAVVTEKGVELISGSLNK